MNREAYTTGDLIAALATPRGRAALAVIRMSGPGCIERVANAFSRPRALVAGGGYRVHLGWLLGSRGEKVDEVLLTVFKAPRSYTGEDSVEISCHGGLAVVDTILNRLRDLGFRDAAPGEFTFRAFSSGRLDLTRAEAVREIIDARTERARVLAVSRLAGSVGYIVDAAKEVAARQATAAALALDYPEDETEAVPFDFQAVRAARASLEALIATWSAGRIFKEGIMAALAGPSNAGKSSLFNLFLKEDRSIVTETPGTTRDWVEADLNLDGIPFRLVDTAGLREDSGDPIEHEGMRRTRELLSSADLVIAVADGTAGEEAARTFCEMESPSARGAILGRRVIRVWNKADIAEPAPEGWLGVSALTGAGFPELEGLIKHKVVGTVAPPETDAPVIESARQKDLLQRAVDALKRFDDDSGTVPVDLLAEELREALDALGELTGAITRNDILERMFGEFCVGK